SHVLVVDVIPVAYRYVGTWVLPDTGLVRNTLGHELGHIGTGSPGGSPVIVNVPVTVDVPTAVNDAIPFPLVAGVLVTAITLGLELEKRDCRVASVVLPLSQNTVAVTCCDVFRTPSSGLAASAKDEIPGQSVQPPPQVPDTGSYMATVVIR